MCSGVKLAGMAAIVGSVEGRDFVVPGGDFAPRRRAKYQSSFSMFVVGKRK